MTGNILHTASFSNEEIQLFSEHVPESTSRPNPFMCPLKHRSLAPEPPSGLELYIFLSEKAGPQWNLMIIIYGFAPDESPSGQIFGLKGRL
jgi:hypothetical protein